MSSVDNSLEFADTVFVSEIESKVFQSIVIHALASIQGISFIEGNLLDHILGRETNERVKGIWVEQDPKNHSVQVKIELNCVYGVSLPKKAEEIQIHIAREITRLTDFQVALVHVTFKGIIHHEKPQEIPYWETHEPS